MIAAASSQTGQAEAILSPVLNTGIINQFLDQFSRSLADDVQAVMIWDGAGFHTAHDLPVPSNVTLIQLPPYSPELNGIENLWHYLRSHFWSNRVYLDYDDLFEVAESTWCKNCLNPELIKSVCAKSYTQTRSELLGSGQFATARPIRVPRNAHLGIIGQEKFVTQCYVKGHPGNEKDGILRSIRDGKARGSVLVDFIPIQGSRVGELAA